MRNSIALSLALVAIGAISALAATSASASYNIASAAGGTISGSQVETNMIQLNIGTFKCTTFTMTGSQSAETTETATLQPTWAGCTLAGLKVTVDTSKCHFQLTKPTTTDALNPPVTTHAIFHLKCSTNGGGVITTKDSAGLGCELQFGEQETKGQVMLTNEAAGTVLTGWELEGIAYSWTAACPNSGGKAGSASNGKYTGTVRVEGQNFGGTKVALKVT